MFYDFRRVAGWATLILLFFCSCDGAKMEKAQEVLKQFEVAYKAEDLSGCEVCFPDIQELRGSTRKVDEFVVEKAEVVEKDVVEISAKMRWVNPMKKEFVYDVVFYLAPKVIEGKESYVIQDTKNFMDFSSSYVYRYLQKKMASAGLVKDLEKSRFMTEHEAEYQKAFEDTKNLVCKNLTVSNCRWSPGVYSDYASGTAVVQNNTGFVLPSVKYLVSYLDKDLNLLTQDQGVVCYGQLEPGQMASFSFYTPAAGSARKAKVQCYVDDMEFMHQLTVELGR